MKLLKTMTRIALTFKRNLYSTCPKIPVPWHLEELNLYLSHDIFDVSVFLSCTRFSTFPRQFGYTEIHSSIFMARRIYIHEPQNG